LNCVSRFVLTVFFLAAVGAGAEASTITVDGVGDAFTVQYSGFSNQDSIKGYPVSVDSSWLTTIYSPTTIQFQITLDNTSPTDPAQLTGFGFNTDPDAIAGVSTSLLFPFVSLSPNGSFTFDICVQGPPENASCTGNSGNPETSLGVNDAPDVFYLTLTFATTTGGVTFSDFGARLQGIGQKGASAKIYGNPIALCLNDCESDPLPDCQINCGGDPPPGCLVSCDVEIEALNPVPEPGTLLLLGSGAAIALRRRFRRQ
jgi:hypothetical protein